MCGMTRRTVTFAAVFIVVASLSVVVAAAEGLYGQTSRPFKIHVFQIGNSVAMLVRTPDDKRLLINGGPNSEIVRRVTSILPFYSRKMDALIALDIMDKNLTGLMEVLGRYDVSSAYIPAPAPGTAIVASTSPLYEIFKETARSKNVNLFGIESGDDIQIGDAGVSMRFIWASDSQAILKIMYQSSTFLLVGEAKAKDLRNTVKESAPNTLLSDVLVISRNSSDIPTEFISAVNPKFLVHSKIVTKIPARAQSSLRKKPDKTLFGRFEVINLRENGAASFISDGNIIHVNKKGLSP